MRKLIILSVFAAIAIASCKKKESQISRIVTVSAPTITFTGSQYVSIPVGGTVPTVSATAYDSVLHESDPVTDTGAVDANTPGLYIQTAVAKNSNGYTSTSAVYIAVTNEPASLDISGTYARTSNGQTVTVTKLATGLFMTDNFGGVVPPSSAIIPAVFAILNDTTMVVPLQPSNEGPIEGTNITLSLPAPTSYSYVVVNAAFGTAVRTFVKQ